MRGEGLFGESLRFAVVGALATAIHYGVALAATLIASPYLANVCGYGAAVGVSYFGHQNFTFRVGGSGAGHLRRMPRFVVTSLSALLLSQLAFADADFAGLPDAAGLAVAVLTVPPYTFLLNRIWVFTAAAAPRTKVD